MFHVLHSMADTQKTDKQTNKVIAITLLIARLTSYIQKRQTSIQK